MQIAPLRELQLYIKHYLFLENADTGIKMLRLFADGNTGLVLSSFNNLTNKNDGDYLPKSFFYGQISNFRDLCSVNKISFTVVVFQPYGMNHLFGIPATAIKDKIVDVESILGQQGRILECRLTEQTDIISKQNILNNFFAELLLKKINPHTGIVQSSLNFIASNKGNVNLRQLEIYTGYTERHIERVFKECIGLSPKKISNIIKLHHFLKLLNDQSKDSSATNYSYEAGYSDQSHLIKEFRKNTGLTPTQYLHRTKRLAVNFVELR